MSQIVDVSLQSEQELQHQYFENSGPYPTGSKYKVAEL